VLAVAVVATQLLVGLVETVQQIAVLVMVEMPLPELPESMDAVVAVVQVDQEMRQEQQAVMASYSLPLIFSHELPTTTMVQQAEFQRYLSILKQFLVRLSQLQPKEPFRSQDLHS
jgi:hypothetical protein